MSGQTDDVLGAVGPSRHRRPAARLAISHDSVERCNFDRLGTDRDWGLVIMKNLLNGLSRYEHSTRRRYSTHFASLAAGQVPHTLFIGCADSRVVPNLLASAEPGELFVVRNIANLVPPCGDPLDASVQAAVAYAVDNLGVSDIVVCGHSGCGGIKALLGGPRADDSLGRWLTHAQPALAAFRAGETLDKSRSEQDQVSQVCTLHQLHHLLTYPNVRRRVKACKLNLHAWWFDIAPGDMLAYASEANSYVPAIELLTQRCCADSSRRVA